MIDEIMHVGIPEPTVYRKRILNSALDIIQILKNNEKTKLIKKEKILCRREFKRIVKELVVLFDRIKTELPTIKITLPERRIEKIEERMIEKPASLETRKLEEDLARIQEKLSRL